MKLRPLAALIGAAACWGIATVISKRAVEELSPLSLLAVQLAVSCLVLVVLLRLRGIPLRDRAASPVLVWLGVLNPGIAYLLSLVGLMSIDASLSVVLWATEPLLIVILAGLVLGERLGPGVIVAILGALAGLGLLLYEPTAAGAVPGIALTIAGVGCCAVYTVAARRWLGTADGTAPVVLGQQAAALGFVVVALVVASAAGSALGAVPLHVSAAGWLSAGLSGVLYYAAAYWLYLSALRTLPATIAASSFFLIPIFGVATAWVVRDERLSGLQWLGAAIVLVAVLTILRRAAGAPQPAPAA